MPDVRKLTTTSYVVLGLVTAGQPITSYEMKRSVARSIGYFWPFPHSQLYAEPARLVQLGLLLEDVEQTGRKRRRYRISEDGQEALSQWLAEPASEPTEIRDLGMLKRLAPARPSRYGRAAPMALPMPATRTPSAGLAASTIWPPPM